MLQSHIQTWRNKLSTNSNWVAETKVLVILIYYLVLGVVVLTVLTNSLTKRVNFNEEADRYFACEASGIIQEDDLETGSSTCKREGLEKLVNPVPTAIAFALLGLYPAINLVYVINFKELKKELWCRAKKIEDSQNYRFKENKRNLQPVDKPSAILSPHQELAGMEQLGKPGEMIQDNGSRRRNLQPVDKPSATSSHQDIDKEQLGKVGESQTYRSRENRKSEKYLPGKKELGRQTYRPPRGSRESDELFTTPPHHQDNIGLSGKINDNQTYRSNSPHKPFKITIV